MGSLTWEEGNDFKSIHAAKPCGTVLFYRFLRKFCKEIVQLVCEGVTVIMMYSTRHFLRFWWFVSVTDSTSDWLTNDFVVLQFGVSIRLTYYFFSLWSFASTQYTFFLFNADHFTKAFYFKKLQLWSEQKHFNLRRENVKTSQDTGTFLNSTQ